MKSKFTYKLWNYERGILGLALLCEIFGKGVLDKKLNMHWKRRIVYK